MKIVLSIAVLALAGCVQSNIFGASNGSAGSGESGATGATGIADSVSASGGHPGASTGVQPGTATGPGANGSTGVGPGTGTGTIGGNGSTGNNGTSGGFNGTGGFTGGGFTGGSRETGTNGGTGGRRLPDAGPCVSDGTQCASSDECCSGTCAGVCTQGAGEACFINNDCVSFGCDGGTCLCSQNAGEFSGTCGTSQDCCDQGECTFDTQNGNGYGRCCNDLGSGCLSPNDCCDGLCANGQCQCQPAGGSCYPFNECCSGICNGVCQSPPGGPCSIDSDCTNANCVNGTTCGTCGGAGGACSSQSACCDGLSCASPLIELGGSTLTIVDGGPACCQQAGAACQGTEFPGEATGCCGKCDNGNCACVGPTGNCTWDISCCAGGACMVAFNGLACCQTTGQTCFSGLDCCTGFCGPAGTCACMPDGGYLNVASLGAAACCDGAVSADGFCL